VFGDQKMGIQQKTLVKTLDWNRSLHPEKLSEMSSTQLCVVCCIAAGCK